MKKILGLMGTIALSSATSYAAYTLMNNKKMSKKIKDIVSPYTNSNNN